MSEISEQINWLKAEFSKEARKVSTGARGTINYRFYERVIENTKRKYPTDPLLGDLDTLLFEFGMLGRGYTQD
ncbi:hypothetical protein [Vibrio sp. NH-UV-68]|uniref:hypothetical protein n=1 Tax=unclassified Vibrio TaxID=2614977 RepID=UPI0036F44E28